MYCETAACRQERSVLLKDAFLLFDLDLHFHFNNPLKSLEQALVIKKTTFCGHKATGITNESH